MSAEEDSRTDVPIDRAGASAPSLTAVADSTEPAPESPDTPCPPTTPCTVVWSRGRPYVLESGSGRPRWMGVDHQGRPQALTNEALRRQGWSYHRSS
ncbi:hypothetical protein [Saccharomonospora sp. NB11]|jgi:hypothetical protein|uniref:hypothetical protein n=1 Tax=Saccharomonospora sp. NB11 TaxID=1642298 RepID=UPI0018D112CD|nr:hypothetical protein [Saccharomonospora sp. NB11]